MNADAHERRWRRARACSGGNCVEVLLTQHERVHVRDAGGRLVSYTYEEWSDFLAGVKAGEFDLPV